MPRQKQRRIVLDVKHQDYCNQILQQTGINTPSQLFTVLLKNYGDKLVRDLKQ